MSSERLFPSIPSQWKVTTLGELAKASGGDIQTGPFGSQLHAGDYVDDGIPSIMPKNISVDAVTTDDIARVSPEDVERLSKYKVQVGDIVYSRRGDVEKCARITEKEDGWLCGTGCLRVRVKPESVSTEYLHAYLCHPTVREWIVRHAVGATMPNLNTSILSALPVVIPSNAEMAIIASIWLTISDKIQLNHQINKTLEQMAQAIFKSWFVNFEPVKAKVAALEAGGSEEDALLAAMQAISGKSADGLVRLKAEQPEQYAELRATAELFPSAMQDSELGVIPEGWSVSTFSEISDITMGQSPKGDTYNSDGDGMPLVNGPVEFGSHHPKKIKWTIAPTKSSQKNDLIVCVRGSTTGRFVKSDDVYCLGRGVCAIHAGECQPYLDRLFKSELPKLLGLTTGSTFPSWSGAILKGYQVLIPKKELLSRYSSLFGPIDEGISARVIESSNLASLRDTLLPKLLSGKLSVSDAEGQLEKAQATADV
ncbi:restriction endonuclease subunit S [Halomonas sp. HK25]|uniref:restriction endonuclease subunit S n=1 Tax=Halomonas sp. HK25 TaxID=3394321 RepID=UPI0039FD85F0